MVLFELKEVVLWQAPLLGVLLCAFPFVLPHLSTLSLYWDWGWKLGVKEERYKEYTSAVFFKIAVCIAKITGCIALILSLVAFVAQCRKNEEIRGIYQKYEVRWVTGCVEDYEDLPDDRQAFSMDGKRYVLYSDAVNLIREGQHLKIGYFYDPATLSRRVTYAEELMAP